MAAIVMIFEMTLDYRVIIPMTITVALSYGIRKVLCPESIYTLKLARRGHHIPSALHANLSHVRRVKDIMQIHIHGLPASSTLDAFAKTVLEHPEQSHFLVHDGDRIVGLVGREAAWGRWINHASAKTLGQAANTQFIVVSGTPRLPIFSANVRQGRIPCPGGRERQAPSVADIQGIVTEHETAEAMIRSVDLFCD